MMKLVLVSILFSVFSFAQAAEVDLSKSSFRWFGDKVTGDKHEGTIKMKSAKLGKTSGEFVADMNSVDVEELSGKWKTKFLTHIKSPDFFDVGKYPTAKLVIGKVVGKKLSGQLTIKGKTHPVEMNFSQKGKFYEGVLEFDRTKFGMVYKSGNFFKDLGDKIINDTVKITVRVTTK